MATFFKVKTGTAIFGNVKRGRGEGQVYAKSLDDFKIYYPKLLLDCMLYSFITYDIIL